MASVTPGGYSRRLLCSALRDPLGARWFDAGYMRARSPSSARQPSVGNYAPDRQLDHPANRSWWSAGPSWCSARPSEFRTRTATSSRALPA